MIRPLLLIALTLPLAACDLNPIEGKPSQFQLHQERIAALEARAPVVERVEVRVVEYVAAAHAAAPVADVVADIVVEPVVDPDPVELPPPAPEPEVVLPEPEPVCQPIFRVVECP